ncbi:hypothetical protein VA7868_00403 [Vibrio aerogenes CECT 7868]|uniref:Lipoprotein n=1 Tax=Vibrio aerogenes CECT 7868 TaxID=1216006 RepID=A0A1M5VJG0_9VIBR|nr:hypothetical protein [Vibrio aerogenes]SHH75053.1 hypothetical protein VA7868_00403 [Vibrio aerogenes CECT 7868]
MEKNKNSGAVFFRHLCSFGGVLLLSACSGIHQERAGLTESYQAYQLQRTLCVQQAGSGSQVFPQSEWLKQLPQQDKQEVLAYLSVSAFNQCVRRAKQHFDQQVRHQSKDVQDLIFQLVPEHDFYIENISKRLDTKELRQLKQQVSQPFRVSDMLNRNP